MAKGLLVDTSHRDISERHTHTQPRLAKISFSKRKSGGWTLPDSRLGPLLEEHDRTGDDRDWVRKKAMFLGKIGDFLGQSVNNIKRMKHNINLHEDVDGAVLIKAASVSIPRERRSLQLRFARLADSIDPGTKETLYEVKEDVVETAQKARVPVPSATLPYIGYVHSLTVKNLLCGILAGSVASLFVVPLDILKTRAIAGQGGRTVAQVFNTVAQEEGLQTLMKGSLKFNIVKNALERGLQFTTFEFVKRREEQSIGKQRKVLPLPRQIPLATAGGAAAGLVGTFLSYPLQPIFDRLLLQPDKYKSLLGTLKQILSNEGGVGELYRGLTPALIAIVPNVAVSFYTYDTLKNKYLVKKIDASSKESKPWVEALQTLVIGGLAGAISTTVTYPLEEARKQILLSAMSSSKAVNLAGGSQVHYNNIWQALTGIVSKEGWRGLYRGLTAQNLQIVPMTAVTFLVYELAKRVLVASGEERRDEVKDVQDLEVS